MIDSKIDAALARIDAILFKVWEDGIAENRRKCEEHRKQLEKEMELESCNILI